MCGVNGIFAYRSPAGPVDERELHRTRDSMAARGPDGAGAWVSEDGRIGLGHRRLAIIDLSDAGAQPMHGRDGSLVITFNGEIYNYRELRRGLEAKGCVFHSQSDTEVLLHLYAEKGEAMLPDLRGMFAFGIWDEKRRRLFLARDPYGIKPLYYADNGSTLRFASQVKALLAGGHVSREPEPAGWVGFFLLGSVPGPFTTFRAMKELPAGTSLAIDGNGPATPRRYHSIAAVYSAAREGPGPAIPESERREKVRAALRDSVAAHLVADVPVGAFLSAGIDSGALVGLMRDAGHGDIQTVTLGFEEFRGQREDETHLAAEVARVYDTRHVTRLVTRSEFEGDLARIVDAVDQPSIDGVNTWFVAKAARERGLKVAISGLGGDELFGGYPSFQDIPSWVRRFGPAARVPQLGRLFRTIVAGLPLDRLGVSRKTSGVLELGGSFPGAYLLRRGLFMPWELAGLLDPDMAAEGLATLDIFGRIESELRPDPGSDFARIAVLESTLYMRHQLLRDTDWASMAHSLEVRTPLVDSVLLAQVAGLTGAEVIEDAKRDLAVAPSRPLPESVVSRKKTGFTVPISAWTNGTGKNAPGRAFSYARAWALRVGAEAGITRDASRISRLQRASASL